MRWRIVYQKEALELTYDISMNLNVDLSTVKRTVKLFRETGSVNKRPYPTESATKKLMPVLQSFILNMVRQKPGIYLLKIKQEAEDELFPAFIDFCVSLDLLGKDYNLWLYNKMLTYEHSFVLICLCRDATEKWPPIHCNAK